MGEQAMSRLMSKSPATTGLWMDMGGVALIMLCVRTTSCTCISEALHDSHVCVCVCMYLWHMHLPDITCMHIQTKCMALPVHCDPAIGEI